MGLIDIVYKPDKTVHFILIYLNSIVKKEQSSYTNDARIRSLSQPVLNCFAFTNRALLTNNGNTL